MELSTWSEQFYIPPLGTRLYLRLGATPYRCDFCRCNFASFRPCKERFSWRRRREAIKARNAQEAQQAQAAALESAPEIERAPAIEAESASNLPHAAAPEQSAIFTGFKPDGTALPANTPVNANYLGDV